MEKQIKLLRLLTGEQIIAELIGFNNVNNKYTIKNVVKIVIIPTQTATPQPSIGFAPWNEFSKDKEFEINHEHIICISEPLSELIDSYNSVFSNIITPKKNLIV